MPELIKAERTAEIIAFIRRIMGDNGYKKYPSNDFLYSIGNSKIEEIAEAKKNIKEDIVIPLSPNQYYYDEADIVEQLENVIRIDSVYLKYEDNTESLPMTLVTQSRFEEERKNNYSDPTYFKYPNLQYRYDANRKRYYYIDENYGLYYWKPVDNNTTRLIIKCSRTQLAGELMSDENNPKISKKFDACIRAGILYELCFSSNDPVYRNQAGSWLKEYEKYKKIGIVKSKSMPEKEYKEF